MADVRVRFPLGALNLRVWESLVLARASGARDRWFKSSHPDLLNDCGGTRAGTGRRLLTALTQVRFLPPQLDRPESGDWRPEKETAAFPPASGLQPDLEGQANWRWHPARTGTSFTALRVRLPLLPLNDKQRALGRAAKAPGLQPGQVGSIPAEHFVRGLGCRLLGR